MAVLWSLLLHVVFGIVLVYGISASSGEIKPPVPLRIQASVVTPQQVRAFQEQKTDRLREEAMERRREEARITEQRRQREEAEREAQRKAREEAAAQAREQQAIIDRERAAEEARQQEIDALRAERERLAEERRQQEADLERIKEQRRQEDEARNRQLEDERLRQLMDLENQQLAAAERVTLEQEYVEVIRILVTQNWRRPPTARPGLRCRIRVDQTPGGDVVSAQIINPCQADEIVQRSIVDAVYRAEPLPYRGYEDVFRRQIIFVFVYDG